MGVYSRITPFQGSLFVSLHNVRTYNIHMFLTGQDAKNLRTRTIIGHMFA